MGAEKMGGGPDLQVAPANYAFCSLFCPLSYREVLLQMDEDCAACHAARIKICTT